MRYFLQRSSSAKEQKNEERSGGSRAHLYLNVYDLSPINNYLYWFGFGIFHSGIEVHGMEYGFGAHDYPTSGVFEVEPRGCPGFIYRRTVWLGTTDMPPDEFRSFIEQLSRKYHGNTYNLIAKNCNHFTNDVCMHLTGKPVPGWVNRLARIVSGSLCNCILPENINVTTVRHLTDYPAFSDGTGSYASTLEVSDDEQLDHHLLTASSSDQPLSKEKPLKLTREKF
ncbi:deSI-like protein At4g17486 isoform X2 [Phalaenopsis equestris]|uniref:deSI-like protein At4g17486 isoform X2 n=2 Tax=Phalaenopsis equestris TaxID=78828 RepID=UPI0009E5611A|nr:deSI-like protein At4g17486 isoform X2 [Phalaenopsis equestris]